MSIVVHSSVCVKAVLKGLNFEYGKLGVTDFTIISPLSKRVILHSSGNDGVSPPLVITVHFQSHGMFV